MLAYHTQLEEGRESWTLWPLKHRPTQTDSQRMMEVFHCLLISFSKSEVLPRTTSTVDPSECTLVFVEGTQGLWMFLLQQRLASECRCTAVLLLFSDWSEILNQTNSVANCSLKRDTGFCRYLPPLQSIIISLCVSSSHISTPCTFYFRNKLLIKAWIRASFCKNFRKWNLYCWIFKAKCGAYKKMLIFLSFGNIDVIWTECT